MSEVEVAAGQEPSALGLDLDVLVAEGGHQATLRMAEVRDGGAPPAPADLCRALETYGVVAGFDADVVERVVKALRSGARFRGQVIIAREILPRPPSSDARVELLVAPGCLVLPDTLLCRFKPRVPGRDGCLITGESVKAAAFELPVAVAGRAIEVGHGVARGGKGLELISTVFGWLNVEGLAFSVSPAFTREDGSDEFRGTILAVSGDGRRVEAEHVRAALEAAGCGEETLDDAVERILEAREEPEASAGEGSEPALAFDAGQGSPGGSGGGGSDPQEVGAASRPGGVTADALARVIDGDVDQRVGNVHCHGAVTISGAVRPRLEVRAGSNLEIHGLIDAARVWSGGDVLASGGIRGGGQAELRAAGSVTTKFIERALVEVQGDLVVESHIHQSTVLCDGKVVVHGAIAGGRVQALRGIEAGTLGSQAQSATILVAGTGFHCIREIERLEVEMAQLHDKRSKLIGALQRLTGNRGLAYIAMLAPARRQVALRLAQTLQRLEGEARDLGAVLRHLRLSARESSWPSVTAKTEVHAGVIVMANDRARSVTSVVSRPCSFQVNDLGEIVMV